MNDNTFWKIVFTVYAELSEVLEQQTIVEFESGNYQSLIDRWTFSPEVTVDDVQAEHSDSQSLWLMCSFIVLTSTSTVSY